MGRVIDADICLNKAWQNFYKQEDEHEKNIDGYDILRDRFYEQSGFECCQQAIVNAPTVEAIPKDQYEQRLKVDLADKSVDEGYLYDWYISSVTDDEPKWTEAHLKELVNDFYLIPKQESENATD